MRPTPRTLARHLVQSAAQSRRVRSRAAAGQLVRWLLGGALVVAGATATLTTALVAAPTVAHASPEGTVSHAARTAPRPAASAAAHTPPGMVASPTSISPTPAVLSATLAAGTDVEQRVLIGEGDEFYADGGPVYVHATVHRVPGAQRITLTWVHDGKTRWNAELPVGKSHAWRTWARRKMSSRDVGLWRVEARDEAGSVLGHVEFTVLPAPHFTSDHQAYGGCSG